MAIYGYARVGTDGQALDAQTSALTAAGAARVFRETASGAKTDRRELARALRALDAGDALLVTRLDRLARSTRDLLNILDTIAKAGADFRSLGDAWADTTTPHGRLMPTVLGGLAEFERALIRARTGEGRIRAKARGVPMGRPPKLTPRQKREALKALADGAATQADLARRFHLSQSTISRLAAKATPAPLTARPPLDAETERAARAFLKRLEGKYSVVEAFLYGSRARGDHTADSDADLAVILKGERGDRYKVSGDMAGIAFDVMLETGVLVSPLPLWEDEFQQPERFSNPALIANIKREGLRL
ncbi:MAG: recombinase family protein [Roseiarcus sp.]|jgi:DNA invertase Pin-like site-specific DNA recombinase